MLDIPGYRISEIIHHGACSIVCRGKRLEDDKPVVLKLTRSIPPKPSDIARFNQEHAILTRLGSSSNWFARVEHPNRLVLVTEDIGARSLASHMAGGKLSLFSFLSVASKITENLIAIHSKGIVHRDINPHNIVWNPDTGALRIIDFNISISREQAVPAARNPSVLEGTLAYMAPEQTGRMNRSVDYRADFYSLGVTFYRLLTGSLPFTTSDLTELVHAHLAVSPTPVHEAENSIPRALSDIVDKLLTKEPAERYQSARALRCDLQRCLEQYQAHGTIEPFEIATRDIPEVFRIPGRLYGRDREIVELRGTFEKVSQGHLAMTLVSGYSGIGKSALVHELYRPIAQKRGRFISGKFEQYRRNVPYSGVVSAFQEMVRELLTEPEEVLAIWRAALQEAFGPNGAIVTEVIPEVELIVGAQEAVPVVGPTEAQNRFSHVFLDFIRVFCRPDHPLVLFLDDLQWADSASLRLLELIVSSNELEYLHLVGAYRDNEVSASHPLMILLRRLHKERGPLQWIGLLPLGPEHIASLLVDSLHRDRDSVAPLAKLIGERTSGNPFFVNQFLLALCKNGGLLFDHDLMSWSWDDAKIDELGITDNVVGLMVERVKLLPESTASILRLAACVGNHFDVETLALILQATPGEIHQNLLPALEERLIAPLTSPEPTDEGLSSRLMAFRYRFLHDRVHQAAHSLLDEREMKATHLKIGRLLLANLPEAERGERIFQIVDHLNLSRDSLENPAELLELARLDLEAGRKAKAATAYSAARWYLETGMKCLPADSWQEHYELAVAMHKERGEVEYLSGNFASSIRFFDLLMGEVATPLEKAEIYGLLITLYTYSGNFPEALQMCRAALDLVGVELPREEFDSALQAELGRAEENLGDREILSLLDLPEPTRPETQMAIKLLSKAGPLAFLGDPDLFPIVAARSVNLSIEQGHIAESAVGYCNYGLILASKLRRYQDGYDFASLAQQLSQKLEDRAHECVSSMMVGTALNHWVKPFSEAEAHNREAYRAGIESGEYLWTGYLVAWRLFILFHQGLDLGHCLEEAERALAFSRRAKHQLGTSCASAYQVILSNLAGRTRDPTVFRNNEMDDEELLARYTSPQEIPAVTFYKATKAMILYLYGDYAKALDYLEQTAGIDDVMRSTSSVVEHGFYYSLTVVALYGSASAEDRERYERILEANQEKMQSWAQSCPENFENRYLLVEAERARIRGGKYEAAKLYDRAIESASAHRFVQNHALANELAGRLWLELGHDTCAAAYISTAIRSYEAWGAEPKADMLAREHAPLLEASSFRTAGSRLSAATGVSVSKTSFSPSSSMDFETVIKASQAISSEIVLDSLLARLLAIVLENVGAELGYAIISDEDGQLQIEAGTSVNNGDIPDLSFPLPLDVRHPRSNTHVLPQTIINYASRTGKPVVLHDASSELRFMSDSYVARRRPKSLMCMPIMSLGQLVGLLYLENSLIVGAFTAARVDFLQLLTSQISISLKNAQLYRENERARVAAEAANRAKTTFLATMSHELRTPLNVIIGYAELVCDEFSREEHGELRDDLEAIRTSAHNLMSVLGSILDLAKIEAGRTEIYRERFELVDLLQELEDAAQPMVATRNNSFELICADGIQQLVSDKPMVQQILLNLLSNACKFTEDGMVRLEVDLDTSDGSDGVKFTVKDTGIGMSAEEQARVFEAFVQADSSTTRKYGGTGLGLTISRKFADSLGGRITMESVPGEGSSFSLHLPMGAPVSGGSAS